MSRRALALLAACLAPLTLSVLAAAAPLPGTLDLTGYEMTFEDDFSKPDVVAQGPFSAYAPGMRWIAHTPWNGDFGEARFSDPGPSGPFAFGRDGLTLTMRRDDKGKWSSGLICSVDRDGPSQQGFAQRYGYFEMRARLPGGPGTWPAFWLVGVDKSNGSAEIDVIEYYGKFDDGFHTTTHLWKDGGGFHQDHDVAVEPASLISRFNDYGVLIGPERTTFYLNRVEYLEVPTPPEYRQPMYMLVDLGLGGGWPTAGLEPPVTMQVSHVRAYRDPKAPR